MKVRRGDIVRIAGLCTVDGDPVAVPDPHRIIHLQFRESVVRPNFDSHLQWMLERHSDIVAARIHQVVVFPSTPQDVRAMIGDLPIDMVADPDTQLHGTFGVYTSPPGAPDPHGCAPSLRTGLRRAGGARLARFGPRPTGGPAAPAAELLIDVTGVALAAKYGRHVHDHWSVDELLALARAYR